MRAPFRLPSILALSIVSMSQAGCSSDLEPPPFPVTGSVLVDGKPAAYAKLTFRPVSADQQQRQVFAKADENGEFTLFVPMPEDGESAIEYLVGISWRIPRNPRDRNDPNYGEELLPKNFQDPKQSGVKVEIGPGVEELDPFELKI